MTVENKSAAGGSMSTATLRLMNRESLINLLGQRGGLTRGQMAEETGLTGAAISRITREMLDAGVLVEGEKSVGRVGRPEAVLSINPTGAFVLAISLTANRRNITLANALGEVVATRNCDDLDPSAPLDFLDALVARAKALTYDADFNRSRLLGVGVAAAISCGACDAGNTDEVTSNPLGWRKVPVRERLSKALNLPVRVEHRASAILRSEIKRRSEPHDIYLVNVALGIGTSAHLDGRHIASGSSGLGSLCHFRLLDNNTHCDCGRRGCLEVTAAGRTVVASLGSSDAPLTQQSLRLNEAVQAADSGDAKSAHAFRKAGRRLGIGIDAVIALLNPKTVVLSGEVGRQPDYFAGVLETLEAAGRANAKAMVERSNITSADAAISVALQNYVFTGNLNIQKLKAA